ncbi:MAG: ATP-binding cassette domain-containing protein, partial [Pseudomonadota bacterium]
MTALLEISDLSVRFPILKGLLQREVGSVRAVNGVSFAIRQGEAFGLVGESGCGKTTLARTVLRLEEPSEGQILFEGADILPLSGTALRPYRRRVAAIFQDPFGSLNPRMTAGAILKEVLTVHAYAGDAEARVLEL